MDAASGHSALLLTHPGPRREEVLCNQKKKKKKKIKQRGAWVAQSLKPPTLDFGSGHGLAVGEFEPYKGLRAGGGEPAWVFSLSQNKYRNLKQKSNKGGGRLGGSVG